MPVAAGIKAKIFLGEPLTFNEKDVDRFKILADRRGDRFNLQFFAHGGEGPGMISEIGGLMPLPLLLWAEE